MIGGLSGIGVYFLSRSNDTECKATLKAILKSLVKLSISPNNFYTTSKIINTKKSNIRLDKFIDLGMSHGISGPLALLFISHKMNIKVPGSRKAISILANLLLKNALHYKNNLEWPAQLYRDRKVNNLIPIKRTAWCYGNPGIAVALWLAWSTMGNYAYKDAAENAMKTVYKKSTIERNIDSPNFCHGVSGLLLITMRFLNWTNERIFNEMAQKLVKQIMNLAIISEKKEIVNFKLIRKNDLGVLEGKAGILLALLSATTNKEPCYDRIFLLS